VYRTIREHVPFIEHDVVMYPLMEMMRQLVASGAVVEAAETALSRDGESTAGK
jgi:hypothetical protein